MSRSSHRSPLPPTTPAEALARAQLLLDYPPTADKTDEWRATIQSLIGFANGDTARSSHRSPLPPTTPAEALARAQLLLDYPPTADKTDEWRATIQSLIGFANGDTARQPSTSLPR